MSISLRPWVAVVSAVAITLLPVAAQSPTPPVAPPAGPEPPAKKEAADPAPPPAKPEAKKSSKSGTKKSKRDKEEKERKERPDFDPKSLLMKLVLQADDDGDGALSVEEFRRVPLLKELKKERVESLFADIDANTDASLSAEEIGKGFGKITDLAKESRSQLDDADAAKQAKKLKRLVK